MKKTGKLKLGVYSITSMLYMQVVVSVLLGNIAMVFPDASLYKIQLVFSITSITCMVGSLVAGKLANFINKKTLTVIALIVLLLSGVGPLAINTSIDAFIIFSAFVGFAVGMIQTLSNSYALELFDGAERNKVIGVNQSVMAIAGTVFIYLAGVIAASNYLNGFYIYIAVIPVLLIVLLCIPRNTDNNVGIEDSGNEKVKVLNKGMIILLAMMLIFASLQGAFMQNISLVVINSGIGDASISGTSISLYIAGGILVGFVLNAYMKLAKRRALAICFFLSGIALLLPVISLNALTVYACGALCGFSCTLFYGVCLIEVPKLVEPKGITMACAYVSTFFALGSFISPYVVNPLSAVFTAAGDLDRLTIAGLATLVCGVISVFVKLEKSEEK